MESELCGRHFGAREGWNEDDGMVLGGAITRDILDLKGMPNLRSVATRSQG